MRSLLLNAHLALGATILSGSLVGAAALAAGDPAWKRGSSIAAPAPQASARVALAQATEADVALSKDSDRPD